MTDREDRVGGEEYDRDRAAHAQKHSAQVVVDKKYARRQLIAFLLIVGIGMFGFYDQAKDNYERCVSGNEIRQVSRDGVLATYDLGISLATPPLGPGEKPRSLTPAEAEEQAKFMENLKIYRDTNLERIPANRTCERGLL